MFWLKNVPCMAEVLSAWTSKDNGSDGFSETLVMMNSTVCVKFGDQTLLGSWTICKRRGNVIVCAAVGESRNGTPGM